MLKSPPESRREATIRIGIAHEVSISDPKTTFPVIAPKRATAKLTAIAVDLQRERKKIISAVLFTHFFSNAFFC